MTTTVSNTTIDNTNLLSSLQKPATTTTSSSSSSSAQATLSQNYTTFIKLLTSQLQNQDPLNPTDTSQFTQQLVQYSQVEQQIDTNSKLDTLISQGSNSGLSNVVGYIGKDAELNGNQLSVTNGVGEFSYTLSKPATNVSIQITDANGNVVRNATGGLSTGKQVISWDGKDDSGNQLNDGTYTFKITATDQQGNNITSTSTGFAQITGVSTASDGSIQYASGSLTFANSSILSLSAPPAVPTGTNNSSNG